MYVTLRKLSLNRFQVILIQSASYHVSKLSVYSRLVPKFRAQSHT